MTAAAPPLERAVWSDLHGRPWTITGRQYAALVRFAWLADWLRLTQREIARTEGYSLTGAHTFLVSMRAGGLLAVRTRRGCRGGTWIHAGRGLLAALNRRPANVPPVDRRRRSTTAETLPLELERPPDVPSEQPPGDDPPGEGLAAWRRLGEQMGWRKP
jgi:hypothetical protein